MITEIKPFLLLYVAMACVGCGDNFIYDKTQNISGKGWAYQDTLNYTVNIEDTLKLYNLGLTIHHTKAYPNQNLYIQIHTKFPSGQRFTKRVNIDFAEPSGKWYGNCSGNHCALSVDIQQGAYFNEVGAYTFTVEQFTRSDSLPNINKIRFTLEDTQQQRK